MFVLLGQFTPGPGNAGMARYLRRHHWGRMWSKDHPQFETPYELCGFDNGAYHAFRKGLPFDATRFLRRLDEAWRRLESNWRRCVVAVVPDIVAGGLRSLEFSFEWRLRLPEGMPWHLAVQDGMTVADVEPHLDLFSGLFLGGSDAFKRTAATWCDLAHRHGKTFHWGRCRNVQAVREARLIGADSIDSANPVLAWCGGSVQRLRAKKWLRVADGKDDQPRLFG